MIDNISGDAKKSCAGNFALRARCKVARGTSRSALVARLRGELRAYALVARLRGELRAYALVVSGAGNFLQRTAGMPCRTFAKQLRIFAQQKYGSERAVSKVGYFFDSLSSLKLSLYIAMT